MMKITSFEIVKSNVNCLIIIISYLVHMLIQNLLINCVDNYWQSQTKLLIEKDNRAAYFVAGYAEAIFLFAY